jgi:urease accessory protein
MLRATQVLPAGTWPGKAADVVRLDYDRRRRRRMALVGHGGLAFLLDLAKAPVLAGGDGICLEDGRIVVVEAAAERLLEIACADGRALARVAWHLGNRHLASEIGDGTLYIRYDHVIADMVMGLGAAVRDIERPFHPEGGAYGHDAAPNHLTDGLSAHAHHDHGHAGRRPPQDDGV